MAKQGELKGIERPKIQEVEDKAEVYEKTMRKRVKLSAEEKADKTALIEVMKKHKLETYRMDSGQVVVVGAGKATVKITEAEEKTDGDDEPEASEAAN